MVYLLQKVKEGKKKMKNYYIIGKAAEDEYGYIVELTTAEADAVQKVLNTPNILDYVGGGWCGNCWISKPHDTLEDAQKALYDHDWE